jgi:pimeloyl-ACP methyl ester carboxylesterase
MGDERAERRTEALAWRGHELVFRRLGEGSPVLLIHGIAGSFETWDPVLPALGRGCHVIAPDLLGHGRSAKPRGDYSLGAYATGLRDLLRALEIDSVTVVGHSMGGGIAMQFAYQFPERCERLVLVSSGGLGPEVTALLKAATLPGADLVLSLATSDRVQRFVGSMLDPFRRIGLSVRPSIALIAQQLASLQDHDARRAFILTARSVLDLHGQRIDARDRLYLAEQLPTMIIWGGRDKLIPVAHAKHAHELITGSRLEIFEEAGHFPHQDEPERFARVLLHFLSSTEPGRLSDDMLRYRPTPWKAPMAVEQTQLEG